MSSLLPRLRIFISSPGDVDTERKITARVLERLAGEFRGRLTLEPYFWEDEPMRHQQTFQDQIPATGDFDLVICILWSRLGTPLTGPDGKAYLSGTDYEVESAREAFEKTGKPDLMIYLNQTPAQLRKLPREERERMLSQLEALEDFVERHCFDRRTGIIKGAFAAYRDLGQFEDALEKHVRKFVQARLPAEDPASEPPRAEISWHGRPFQGLRAFDFEHAPIFFGRTRATGEVLALLRRRAVRLDEARAAAIGGLTEGIDPAAATFVLVCAMSGVGKSSLVRAGVLPLLVQPGGGIGLWRRVVLRPSEAPAGGDLFDALAQELTKPNGLPELLGAGVTARELAFMLRQNPLGIELLLKQALSQAAENVRANESTRLADEIRHCRETGRSHDVERLENLRAELRPPPARLAVVIDQMEELFTLEGVTPDLRRRFVQVLAALARSGWAWVIGTLRSDFFARCAELPDLMQLKAHGLYDLQPPTADELGQMIRRPAAAAGLRFERNAATDTELDQTLRDVAARSPEALPLLEFALDQLYERRTQPGGRLTWAAYEEIGGLEGALACAAEEALAAVEPWRQETFDHVMGGLVTLGTDLKKGAHRRTADYETLTRPPGARTMVDRFIETRLFVADKDTAGHAIVSVAHEALLARKTGFDPGAAPDPAETTPRPPAGDASERVWLWTRLGEWIDANADFLRMRAQVAAGLKQWQDAGGDTGFLLPPGRRLADGETILRERPQALSAEEQSYIARSLAAETGRRTRQARVRALVSTGLALLALGAGIGAWFGFRGRRVAQRQTLEAEKQRVTATQNERLAREKEGRMRASASLSDFFQADDLAKAQQLDDSMAFLARALRRDPSNYAAARRVLFVAQQYSWYLPQANDFPAGVRLIDRVPQPGGGARLLGEQRGEVRLYDELGRAVSPSFGSEVMNVPKDGVESLLPSLRLCDGGRAIATPGLDQNKGPRYWSASTGKPIAGAVFRDERTARAHRHHRTSETGAGGETHPLARIRAVGVRTFKGIRGSGERRHALHRGFSQPEPLDR